MPEADAATLDVLFTELLEALADEKMDSVPDVIKKSILARLNEAPPLEIEEGLHNLWRLMRNITCEHCWTHLPPEKRKGNTLRDEIRNYFSDQEQARRQLEEAMPIEDAAKILRQPGAIKSLADFILGPNELSKEAAALSARLNSGQDPFSIHLPYTKAFMEDSWQPVGWTDYSERLDKAFQLLEHIAVIAHDRLGDTPLFWAVLGPIHDTLHHDAQHGFRQEIRRSEYLVLRKRVAEGRADMWDYWMLLHHESETDRVYVCDEMIDHALAASGVELEAFFEALDDEREDLGNRMPEIELPNPDRLWRQILERPQPSTLRDRPRGNQESAVSVRLLGRGGLYFWTTSTQHYGPSLMLAALGIALEGDLLLRFHDLDIPPFLPFWTGAKVAAEVCHWIFARDCFHRALLDIRLFASGLTTEGWRRAVEEYRFDLSFVDELFLRFGDEPIPQLHVALYFAIESLQAADVAEDAVIRLKFEHLGRRHKVQILGDVIRLSGALGERLWSRLP